MSEEKDYNYTGYNKNLKEPSRELRSSMTRQERRLWYDFLKEYHVRFNRQRPIGSYIADFYCSSARLVIEIDGSQHYTKEGKEYDDNRTSVINEYGLQVIRFSNYDVDSNFYGVCTMIDEKVKELIG